MRRGGGGEKTIKTPWLFFGSLQIYSNTCIDIEIYVYMYIIDIYFVNEIMG